MNFFKLKQKPIKSYKDKKHDFIKKVYDLIMVEYRLPLDKKFAKSIFSFADRAFIKKEKWDKELEDDPDYVILKILGKK